MTLNAAHSLYSNNVVEILFLQGSADAGYSMLDAGFVDQIVGAVPSVSVLDTAEFVDL
jgi:hypothetical protein